MDNQLISVIVPIYNTAPYLNRCLTSIHAQTYSNLEVWLVDDGSTDDSADVCRLFCDMDRRFNYLYQENAGQSAARNNGLAHATGELVSCIDSDDYIDPDFFEALLMVKQRHGAQLVQSQCRHEGFPGITADMEREEGEETACTGDELITNVLLSQNGFKASFCQALVDRCLFSGRQFLVGHLFEDLELLVVMASDIDKALSVPFRKYVYCYREGNSSSLPLSKRKDDLDAVMDSIRACLQGYAPKHLPEADARHISNGLTMARSAVFQDGRVYDSLRDDLLKCEFNSNYHVISERVLYRSLRLGKIAFIAATYLYIAYKKVCYIKSR